MSIEHMARKKEQKPTQQHANEEWEWLQAKELSATRSATEMDGR